MLSTHHQRKRAACLLIILAFSYLFFFYNLGAYSLKEPDEGRYAEIPREMVVQGDYVVPHLNYVRYFEKPPLLYWACAASYKLFGVTEWSFRFPNTLAAVLCVVMTYLFAARWFSGRVALLSSLMLTTSFGFFALARIVTIDMLFAFLLFASLSCFYEFYLNKRPAFLYLFFIALALAVLAKGPVAVILLAVTIVLFLYTEGKVQFLKEMASAKGVLLFGLIAAPWFILISIREKEFFQFFFIDQHILRFLTTKHRRSGPLYYFVPVVLGGMFPWSIFLPRAVVRLWRAKETRLFFIWSLVVFTFFSVSGSKLPPYVLPIFPALSIILGRLFDGEWQHRVQSNREIVFYTVFFLSLALGGFAYGTGLLDGFLRRFPDIASISKDITGLSLGLSSISLITLFLLVFKRMRTFRSLFFLLTAFSLSVALGLMLQVRVIDRINTTKELAQTINRVGGDDAIIVNYGSFHETLPFYIARRTYLADFDGELEMGAAYDDSKAFFLNKDRFMHLFRSDKSVMVVFKSKRLQRLKELGIDDSSMVQCQDNVCLIANKTAAAALDRKP